MVKIVDFKKRMEESENPFNALIVQGGVEMIRSRDTGKFYATAKRASVPSTFTDEECKGLLGSSLPGSIDKVECEPYQYVIQQTGEVVTLEHTYQFNPEEHATIEEAVLGEEAV